MNIWRKINNALIFFICSVTMYIQICNASTCSTTTFNYKNILDKLSEKEIIDLYEFLWTIVTEFECGYVLFGNKPICFMGYASIGNDSVGMMKHYASVALQNGIKSWRKLGLPFESKNYILHEYNCIDQNMSECNKILLINKKELLKVVNENLTLFKYILGPTISAEGLLEKLSDCNSKEGMFSILKNNKVLIGIVLGFGVNNALLVNRQELISEALSKANIDLYSYDDQIDEVLHDNPSLGSTFGNHSLSDEYKKLNEQICFSSIALESECPRLSFGCIPEDKETIALINHYEDIQLKIIKILESKDFIFEVLDKFYSNDTTTFMNCQSKFRNKKTRLNIFSKYRSPLPPIYPNSPIQHLLPFDLSKIIASAVWNQFCDFTTVEERIYYSIFIDGMQAAEKNENALFEIYLGRLAKKPWSKRTRQEEIYNKGYRIWAHYRIGKDFFSLEQIIPDLNQNQEFGDSIPLHAKSCDILNKYHQFLYRKHYQKEKNISDDFFKKFDILQFNQQSIQDDCYAPIVYLSQKQGNGKIIEETDTIRLRYKIKNSTNYTIFESESSGDIVDLSRAIPGLRIGLNSLKEGSKGILYLHPNMGFRDNSLQPPIRPFLQVEIEILSLCKR